MDLGSVDRITADAIGEPGFRVFYIQARSGAVLVTIVVEKQQVQLLAASVLELMANLDLETGTGPDETEMDLELPIVPLWRAGKLSIGYDEGRGMFLLEAEEFLPEPDLEPETEPRTGSETEPETEDVPTEEEGQTAEAHEPLEEFDPRADPAVEAESVRMWASREQMFALSRHAATVAERGRPTCQFCGNPMDPEGHACPAMNGHSTRG